MSGNNEFVGLLVELSMYITENVNSERIALINVFHYIIYNEKMNIICSYLLDCCKSLWSPVAADGGCERYVVHNE